MSPDDNVHYIRSNNVFKITDLLIMMMIINCSDSSAVKTQRVGGSVPLHVRCRSTTEV